jgi:hypothetical protein
MNDSIFWALYPAMGHDRAITEARAMAHNDDAFFSSELIPNGVRVTLQKDDRDTYSIDFIATTEPVKPEPVRFKKPYAGLLVAFRKAGMQHKAARNAAFSLYSHYALVGNIMHSHDMWECIVECINGFGRGSQFCIKLDADGSIIYSSLID